MHLDLPRDLILTFEFFLLLGPKTIIKNIFIMI